MRAILPLPALGLAVLGFVAVLPARPACAAQLNVSVIDFTFSPATLTIQVGDSVTFTNNGASMHNVRADNGSFRCANGCDGAGGNGAPSGAAWSFTRTFTQAGTVRYHCEVHGGPNGAGMSGVIVVQGNAPTAPSNLRAMAEAPSAILLQWTDNASNESEFRIERRTLGGTFAQVATAPANATQATVLGLDPATGYVFRVRAASSGGTSAYSNEAQESTLALPGPCVEGPTTLCLTGGRFRVHVDWRSRSDQAAPTGGNAVPLPAAPSSGLFYFFNPGNIELLVKVLNACDAPFNRYWVFFAATTNVELTLTVTDTQNQRTRTYFNPLNQAALPEQDTDAFATCP